MNAPSFWWFLSCEALYRENKRKKHNYLLGVIISLLRASNSNHEHILGTVGTATLSDTEEGEVHMMTAGY